MRRSTSFCLSYYPCYVWHPKVIQAFWKYQHVPSVSPKASQNLLWLDTGLEYLQCRGKIPLFSVQCRWKTKGFCMVKLIVDFSDLQQTSPTGRALMMKVQFCPSESRLILTVTAVRLLRKQMTRSWQNWNLVRWWTRRWLFWWTQISDFSQIVSRQLSCFSPAALWWTRHLCYFSHASCILDTCHWIATRSQALILIYSGFKVSWDILHDYNELKWQESKKRAHHRLVDDELACHVLRNDCPRLLWTLDHKPM